MMHIGQVRNKPELRVKIPAIVENTTIMIAPIIVVEGHGIFPL